MKKSLKVLAWLVGITLYLNTGYFFSHSINSAVEKSNQCKTYNELSWDERFVAPPSFYNQYVNAQKVEQRKEGKSGVDYIADITIMLLWPVVIAFIWFVQLCIWAGYGILIGLKETTTFTWWLIFQGGLFKLLGWTP